VTRARLLILALLAVGGCHESDIDPMMRQEKFRPYWENDFFRDNRAMRTPPANTVPRERPLAALTPPPVTTAMVQRGRERYDINCAVCHGLVGDGDSVVASKMSLRAPPTLIDDKVRAYTTAQIFDVMTTGYGYMPRYDAQITIADRWAIANYVKALQLSQHALVDEVPADKRGELDKPRTEKPEQSEKKE
jgi:mono/diheme cytochrome c family protein